MSRLSFAERVVWASALYDLIVTLPFATPWTARRFAELTAALHAAIGAPGRPIDFEHPETLMFANLMGSIVVVWSVVRLRSPSLANGLADSVARLAFSLAMFSALGAGLSATIWGFLAPEMAWGLGQTFAVSSAWRQRLRSGASMVSSAA